MPNFATFAETLGSVAAILAALGAVALLELAIPLRARNRWNGVHLAPNLALTFITFATNAVYNVGLVLGLASSAAAGLGLLRAWNAPSLLTTALSIVALDLSFYFAHVAMHHLPLLWRFHRVHHSDPAVDVTTTIRQHPGEGIIRYAFLAGAALALGVTPEAFAIYRLGSVLNGLLEHANIRLPPRLDAVLSLVLVTPNAHKVHHSRHVHETNTNYGNIFSIFDRALGTFTPSRRGCDIDYGLSGLDVEAQQATRSLLRLPFEPRGPAAVADLPPRSRAA